MLGNGTQFASRATAEFYKELKIKQLFTSVEHPPQANGQAEVANKVILRGLRRRLEEAKGRWAEELPQVLWSYHTTPHSTTNETPFCLTFGIEAMIPVEIGEPSPRAALFEPSENEEELRANLDLLQEVREIAHIREYVAKVRAARKHDRKIVPRSFKTRDLVLRKVTQKAESNKLTPTWEGPYRIVEEVGRGAYRLEHLDKRRVPRTWNVATLRINDANRKPARPQNRWSERLIQGPSTINKIYKAQNRRSKRPIRGPFMINEIYKPKTDGRKDRSGVHLRSTKSTRPKMDGRKDRSGVHLRSTKSTRPKTNGRKDRSGVHLRSMESTRPKMDGRKDRSGVHLRSTKSTRPKTDGRKDRSEAHLRMTE
ncbi:Tf2-6, partial [Mucuna pruriens]